jgi:hypothetical protein
MDRIRLLSEIHPQGHRNKQFNTVRQYQEWYEDLGIGNVRALSFIDSIKLLNSHCEQNNTLLVLRDWSHIDFIGPPSRRPPGFKLTLDQKLENDFELLHCVVVRHPMEMWRSLSKMSVIIDNNISLEFFLSGYQQFLQQVSKYPLVRYEDFSKDPSTIMKSICRFLELPFDPDFENKWPDNHHITGDVWNNSRASGKRTIQHFEIQPLQFSMLRLLSANEDYQRIIHTLDYDF